MRIAAVCGFAWEPKGTVRSRAYPLMSELAKLGHEVTLVTVPYDNPEYSGKEFVVGGVRVVNVSLKSKINGLVERVWKTVDLVREIDPDVVHVFKPKGYAGTTAWALLKQGRYPVCLDCDDWEGWGGWNEVKTYPWAVKEFIDWQERSLMAKSHSVTVASRVLQKRAIACGQKEDRIFYVPNCVTSEQLQLQKQIAGGTREQSDQVQIVYAGHFDPADDILFFCRSILPVLDAGAGLTFIGDGPELTKVQAFFPERLRARIRYVSHVPYEEYLKFVSSADIACFPYPDSPVYRAKCSARILDFMMCGKAVVTTRVGQNPEYIEHGASGLLVEPNQEQQFTNAILELIHRPDYRNAIGSAAKARVEQQFLWRNGAAAQTLAAYDCAIPRRSSAAAAHA